MFIIKSYTNFDNFINALRLIRFSLQNATAGNGNSETSTRDGFSLVTVGACKNAAYDDSISQTVDAIATMQINDHMIRSNNGLSLANIKR